MKIYVDLNVISVPDKLFLKYICQLYLDWLSNNSEALQPVIFLTSLTMSTLRRPATRSRPFTRARMSNVPYRYQNNIKTCLKSERVVAWHG